MSFYEETSFQDETKGSSFGLGNTGFYYSFIKVQNWKIYCCLYNLKVIQCFYPFAPI